jgi:hypothetical protein
VSSGVIYSVFPNFICNCREESIKLFRNFTCIIYNFIEIKNHVDVEKNVEFQPITSDKIEKIIDKINIKKASGFDNIPAKVIKQCKPIISNQLTSLINLSIDTGIFVFPNFICNCREESIKLFRNFTCIIYNFIVFTQNYILIPRVTFFREEWFNSLHCI